jgi:predicted anti-sigma-YlaC factor YlaD
MNTTHHYTEEDLILHYYGERRRAARDVGQHLESCGPCRAAYQALAATLALVTPAEPPARGEQYGLEVWQRIRHQLPERENAWWMAASWFGRNHLATAAAALVLVAGAFVAGRVWPRQPALVPASANLANPENLENPGKRLLLSVVADHLDRSERMLTDIMNATSRDISVEQAWADDLLNTSRLYRQDAEDVGEPLLANVLDDIERSLIEIIHSPSHISAAALDQLRRRIDAATLLFKVRVLSDELRRRESAPAERALPSAPTSRIS